MAEQLGSNVLIVLDFDELIPISFMAALSFYFNPRNLEYPHRQTAELFAAKLALLLSPGHRCTFTTEFSFWPWFWDEADQAEDLVALLIDGELDTVDTNALEDIPGGRLEISWESTVSYRACDVVLFYIHLPRNPYASLGHLPALSEEWPRLPLVLIEVKRNASRKPGGDRKLDLSGLLTAARKQLGEQARNIC